MKTLFALTLLAASVASQAAPPLEAESALGGTVQSLLEFARSHNPSLQASQSDARAAAERVESATALPDPRLRTTWQDMTRGGTQAPSLSPNRTGMTSYQWMQDLPWWGKRGLKGAAARYDAQGAQAMADAAWADMAAQIKTLHAQRYLLQASAHLSQDNLELMQRLEQVALTRYAGGLAPQQDVIRAQVEQGNMANELLALHTDQHHAQARLNALLGRSPQAPLAPSAELRAVPPATRLELAQLLDQVLARSPQLQAPTQQSLAAQANRELARKNRYPDFTVGVAPGQIGNRLRQWDLMVEVNIPLQWGARAAQEREAQAQLEAAQARQQAAADASQAAVAQALSALQSSQATQQLLQSRLLPQAELSFQAALAGYESGKVDFATLLEAQRQIRNTQINLLKSQADAQTQLAELERLLGEDL